MSSAVHDIGVKAPLFLIHRLNGDSFIMLRFLVYRSSGDSFVKLPHYSDLSMEKFQL